MVDYQVVKDLLENEQYDIALPIVIGMIEDNPDDAVALNFRGYFHLMMEDEGTAYQFLQRSIDINPNPGNLVNMGKCLNEMGRHEDAIRYFFKSAEMNPNQASAYANASATLVQMSKWEDARKAAELALDCDPEDEHAPLNLAHAQLAAGEWADGFGNFERALGGMFRREWEYNDKGRWNGEAGTVVVYGEQGLGDEITYAQAIPDAAKYASLVIDCDAKLEGLFRRSFPFAEVHGTRRDEHPAWLAGKQVDYRCAIGSLFHLFRKTDSDFVTKPYLVADRERRMMWRSLFDSYGKPVIGIAMKSGSRKNNQAGREIDVAEFAPLMNTLDAVYVSLEYKGDDGGLKAFPWAARSADYDDTAAMIAELDAVVGICTTALHCADALGVPTWTLAPEKHNWKFAGSFPQMENQHLVMQRGTWTETIGSIAQEVKNAVA